MMKYECMKKLLLAGTIAAFIFLTGCSEEPSAVGKSVLPKADDALFRADTLTSSSGVTNFYHPAAMYATRILVGRYADAAKKIDQESWSILQFYNVPDSLKSWTLDKIQLTLCTDYHYGDSLGSFSFSVHEITKSWTGDSLTYDSIKTNFSSTTSTNFLFSNIGDSGSITMDLDTSLVRKWISTSDSLNYGIILEPTSGTVIAGLRSFLSSDGSKFPLLTIYARRSLSASRDTIKIQTGKARSIGRLLDLSLVKDSTHAVIQDGIAYSPTITFSTTPIVRGSVSKAVLEVTLNTKLTDGNSYTSNRLFCDYVTESGTEALTLWADPVNENNQTIYRFLITDYARQWGVVQYSRRISFKGYDDRNVADRFVFYGAAADSVKFRPKIIITSLR
jgi:hypothetical protein